MTGPVGVLALYRVDTMIRGRFNGRVSPVVLKVRAANEADARRAARKDSKNIGQLVSIDSVQVQS